MEMMTLKLLSRGAAAALLASAISPLGTQPALAQTSAKSANSAAIARPSDLTKRPEWLIYASRHSYAELVRRLEEAVKKNKMAVVNAASASDGAKAQGVTIPGNRVVGVFRNDFARRMLASSVAAGIEAPIRFYVTENPDGMATLSYRTPTAVFSPYFTRRATDLRVMAKELDAIFAQIALDTLGG